MEDGQNKQGKSIAHTTQSTRPIEGESITSNPNAKQVCYTLYVLRNLRPRIANFRHLQKVL